MLASMFRTVTSTDRCKRPPRTVKHRGFDPQVINTATLYMAILCMSGEGSVNASCANAVD